MCRYKPSVHPLHGVQLSIPEPLVRSPVAGAFHLSGLGEVAPGNCRRRPMEALAVGVPFIHFAIWMLHSKFRRSESSLVYT